MGKLFGTDGVRGIANLELTPELAFNLGRAGSFVLSSQVSDSRPQIMVGKDTRISGDMLEAALIAGICSTGADVLKVDVIPTPAVAYLTKEYRAACGIVISASHNPVEDNGIKFFGSNGYKLADELEAEIEKQVREGTEKLPRKQGVNIGRVYNIAEADNRYVDFLLGCYSLPEDLSRLTLVVDCANGAAYKTALQMWERLGAKVIAINSEPNGININERCGSTHTESLQQAVVDNRADIGIAYDGDADRCIVIDEKGIELDGDAILTICALEMKKSGKLPTNSVVATVMSNIGLNIALRRENIEVISCKVGDRYVLEEMLASGAVLGGEQSGHIIFSQYATTGDGLLTSLKVVEAMQKAKLPISQLAAQIERQPQILVNVKLENKNVVLNHPHVKSMIKDAEDRLGENGKLVVRPSGTEPLVRIMAQGPDQHLLEEVIENIKKSIEDTK